MPRSRRQLSTVAARRSTKARAEALTFLHLVKQQEMSTRDVMDLLSVPDSIGEDSITVRGRANAFRKEVFTQFVKLLTRKV
jgi:hypothetical protein